MKTFNKSTIEHYCDISGSKNGQVTLQKKIYWKILLFLKTHLYTKVIRLGDGAELIAYFPTAYIYNY